MMAYGIHTELELARTRGPDWLRGLVMATLHAMREAGLSGAPTGTLRDNTGEEHDELLLVAGRWVEAIQRQWPELEPDAGKRLAAGLAALAATVTRWPEPGALWAFVPARVDGPAVAGSPGAREPVRGAAPPAAERRARFAALKEQMAPPPVAEAAGVEGAAEAEG